MGVFIMEIAGTAAEIHSSFGSTREYFREYLSQSAPALCVEVTPEDLTYEQTMLDAEADQLGLRRRVFTGPFLERAAIQRKIAAFVLDRDILLLHGSTIAVDGAAYLFTARCGVGKSTHTRLWREMLGDRAVVVNDDRAFLHIAEEGVLAYGSPWSGKHGLDTNICVPLAGICVLERGTENRIAPLSPAEALPVLADQVFLPGDGCGSRLRLLTRKLADAVPLWKMACTKDPSAARMAFAAMSGRK